ncbi:MAG: NifU family protein [Chloroflexi bacterium]|nr:NifU family protein [Chloroflexota bacterium]
MVTSTSDPKVDFALTQISTMVGSEGGSIEVVSFDHAVLKIRYTPGVNEDCPECVPTHEQVKAFLSASLRIYAPYVSEVAVT